ncbi:MAG: class I SAM-dependent methyltransferase [Anaerolineae bacterium]
MNLLDVVGRVPVSEPWAEGEKIPWHDPAFSQRMLKEHLSQQHDAASRRAPIIERQIGWIHDRVLGGQASRVLDLGCGPGLYTSRLAQLGHECVGIDYAPASIAHARKVAERDDLHCRYIEADLREAEYGSGYDLVMFLFGELNVFRPADAKAILRKVHDALRDGGLLLLEPHTHRAVRRIGRAPVSWYSAEEGLFSERPHLCLEESFWDAEQEVATQRYFVVDAETGSVARHAASTQAYRQKAYRTLLAGTGFAAAEFFPSLAGEPDPSQRDFLAIVACKGPLSERRSR